MAWDETYEQAVERDRQKFWEKVSKSNGPNGCWFWTAARDKRGCGKYTPVQRLGVPVSGFGKTVDAHRYAHFLTYGKLEEGYCLVHTCKNATNGCVNPDHLSKVQGIKQNRWTKNDPQATDWKIKYRGHADTYEEAVERDRARFWANVDKSPHPLGCWIWTGTRNKKTGRGNHNVGSFKGQYIGDGRPIEQAHVYAYILTHGSRPIGHGLQRGSAGIILAHTCDNGHGGCVNPNHLQATTQGKNQKDKIRAGTHGVVAHRKDRVLLKALKKQAGIPDRVSFSEAASEFGIKDVDVLNLAIDALIAWIRNTHGQKVTIDWDTMGIKIHKRKLSNAVR